MIYTKATQSTLIDGKKLGKNFKWQVIIYGYDVENDQTFIDVQHWYTQDQLDAKDVDERRYTKNGLMPGLNLITAENYIKGLTQYTGSV